MRVFAKKAFEFVLWGSKNGEKVATAKAATSAFAFCNLPNWVENDRMFKWAKEVGEIEIIQNKADEKAAELNAKTKAKVGPKKKKLLKN